MKKVMVFGSFITDLMTRAPHLPEPGETVKGSMFKIGPGGKGSNQAVAAHRAGADVLFSTKIGTDAFGTLCRDFLTSEGMDTSLVFTDPQNPSGSALILVDENTSQNMICVVLGACDNFTESDTDLVIGRLSDVDFLLMQLETNTDALLRMAAAAKEHGVKTLLNPAPVQQIPDEVYQGLFAVTPNEVEAKILSGIPVQTPEDCHKAAAYFFNKGVQNVIITLGKNGVYVNDGKKNMLFPNFDVKVVDTTGAGDAFSGGLLASLSEGNDIFTAARFGNVTANLAVTKLGTAPAMPTRKEIDEFMKEIKI